MYLRIANGLLSDGPESSFILRRESTWMQIWRTMGKSVLLVLVVAVVAWTGRELATELLGVSP